MTNLQPQKRSQSAITDGINLYVHGFNNPITLVGYIVVMFAHRYGH